ncbi:MAG: cation diffusion facilitator family transporter [Candidatus Aminicenantaceae bacterium]
MTQDIYRERDRRIRSITLWGALLNLLLMALKIVAGIFIRSTALIADGIHSLSDLATDFVVILSSRLSNRPADDTHPYGHQRFDTLAAVFVSVVLMVVSGGLIWTASQSMLKGEGHFPGALVLVIASMSVISKEVIFQLTRTVAKKTHSASLYANAWHHRSDALSSIAVLAGGIAGLLGWAMADLAATMVVGFMILGVGLKIFYQGMVELTEHSADHDSIKAIEEILTAEEEICGWHALRTRKLGGELFVDLHVLVDAKLTVRESHDITLRIEEPIKARLSKPVNVLIHIEPDSLEHH